jgi:hypothetical protein
VWRKKNICICSLNKPPALHSTCVFDLPTEDVGFLRKFRIAMHASHSALSKSTSKNFCQNAVFPTLSKCRSHSKCQNYFHCCIHVQFTSFAFCTPRGSLPCLQRYFTRRTSVYCLTAFTAIIFVFLPHVVNITSPTKPCLYFYLQSVNIQRVNLRHKYSIFDNREPLHQRCHSIL